MTPPSDTGRVEPSTDTRSTAEPESRSTTTLMSDLVSQVSDLFRKEIQLLRAEMNEKTSQVTAGIGMIVAGVVLALGALNVLLAALVAALESVGLDAGWAALIVGAGAAIIALILVNSGVNNLKASNLAPNRTARSLRKDAEVAKESVR